MTAGYSGTPLAKKLNLRDGLRVWFDDMPENIQDEIGEYALDLIFVSRPEETPDASHIFVTRRADLHSKLETLRKNMAQDGHVWVSWPVKESGEASEIDEHDVRAAGLSIGLVDTKKCAMDKIWSGLKMVIRKELR